MGIVPVQAASRADWGLALESCGRRIPSHCVSVLAILMDRSRQGFAIDSNERSVPPSLPISIKSVLGIATKAPPRTGGCVHSPNILLPLSDLPAAPPHQITAKISQ